MLESFVIVCVHLKQVQKTIEGRQYQILFPRMVIFIDAFIDTIGLWRKIIINVTIFLAIEVGGFSPVEESRYSRFLAYMYHLAL